MKKILSLGAFFIMGASFLTAQTIEEGKNYLNNDNLTKARETFEKVVAAKPQDGEGYYWLGEAYYAEQSEHGSAKARENWSKGAALPNGAKDEVGLGQLQLDAKQDKEAQKTFDSAIRHSRGKGYREGHPDVYMEIGKAYLNGKNVNATEAIDNFTRARDIDPKQAIYWVRLGDAQMKKGDAGAAMTSYETASSKDPKLPEVYLSQAHIWDDAKKLDLALKSLNDGIAQAPNYAPLYKYLVELYIKDNNYNKAIGVLEKYLTLSEALADYPSRLRLVKFLTAAKAYPRAIEEGNKLIAEPNAPTEFKNRTYRWLAIADYESKNYTDAYANSKKLFDASKPDELADYDYDYYAKSSIELFNKTIKDTMVKDSTPYTYLTSAVNTYKQMAALDTSKTCDIYTNIIRTYYRAGQIQETVSNLEDMINKAHCTPTSTLYFYAMFGSFAYLKNDSATIKYATKYIELQPGQEYGYYYRAKALNELDDTTTPRYDAVADFQKVLDIGKSKVTDDNKSMLADAYVYLGYYNGSKNDMVTANSMVDEALKLDPANKKALALQAQIKK